MVTEVNPLDALKRFVEKAGTQKKAAEALGVGESFMSEMLSGRREVSASILEQLGLRRAIVKAS